MDGHSWSAAIHAPAGLRWCNSVHAFDIHYVIQPWTLCLSESEVHVNGIRPYSCTPRTVIEQKVCIVRPRVTLNNMGTLRDVASLALAVYSPAFSRLPFLRISLASGRTTGNAQPGLTGFECHAYVCGCVLLSATVVIMWFAFSTYVAQCLPL